MVEWPGTKPDRNVYNKLFDIKWLNTSLKTILLNTLPIDLDSDKLNKRERERGTQTVLHVFFKAFDDWSNPEESRVLMNYCHLM